MFDRVVPAASADAGASGSGSAFHGTIWFVSTVLLSAIGFFMGPQSFNAIFSARSGDTLRRNAMLLPFYQCFLSLMLFAGLSAALIASGIEGHGGRSIFPAGRCALLSVVASGVGLRGRRAGGACSGFGPASRRRERYHQERRRRRLWHRNERQGAHDAYSRAGHRGRRDGARRVARRATHGRRAALAVLQRHRAICARRCCDVPLAARDGMGCGRGYRRGISRGNSACRAQRRAVGHQRRLCWPCCQRRRARDRLAVSPSPFLTSGAQSRDDRSRRRAARRNRPRSTGTARN